MSGQAMALVHWHWFHSSIPGRTRHGGVKPMKSSFILSHMQCDLNWGTSSVWTGASVYPNSYGTKPLIAV